MRVLTRLQPSGDITKNILQFHRAEEKKTRDTHTHTRAHCSLSQRCHIIGSLLAIEDARNAALLRFARRYKYLPNPKKGCRLPANGGRMDRGGSHGGVMLWLTAKPREVIYAVSSTVTPPPHGAHNHRRSCVVHRAPIIMPYKSGVH